MTTTVLSVGPDTPVTAVATALHDGAVRAVPVLDGPGHLLGVVSEADVLATVERSDRAGERHRHRPRHTRRTPPVRRLGPQPSRYSRVAVVNDRSVDDRGRRRTLDA
jgi:hypothetical protein